MTPTPTDGGPAFPAELSNSGPQCGMSLRDYFAGQALTDYAYRYQNEIGAEDIAAQCYSLADAMLAQRAKGEAS